VTCLAVEIELLDEDEEEQITGGKDKENSVVESVTSSAKKRVLLDAFVEGRSVNLCETIMFTARNFTEDEEEDNDIAKMNDREDEAVVVCSEEEPVLPAASVEESTLLAPTAEPDNTITSAIDVHQQYVSCPGTPLKRIDGGGELADEEALVDRQRSPKLILKRVIYHASFYFIFNKNIYLRCSYYYRS
jgi:hypothetical protein